MTISFPDDILHNFVSRKFKPGVILYLRYSFFLGDTPEDKFFLVASIADNPLLLKIRRELTPYARGKPDIAACHLLLVEKDYTNTLKQDSYLDCTQVLHVLSYAEIEKQLMDDRSKIRDRLTNHDIAQVIKMVSGYGGISPKHKTLIINDLGNVI